MGSLESGFAGPMAFGQGTMDIGQAMAGPIIRQLQNRCIEGHARDDRIVILDAPPGTSCPVVETMRGADYVLLDTEPTPFGILDLLLGVQVARDESGIRAGVVVYRDGIGDSVIDEFCAAEAIPILRRIPLDRHIAEAISGGSALVDAMPESQAGFLGLYREIVEKVRG